MAQRQVLEGDGRRPEEQSADECSEPHHEYHCGTPASRHWSLSRDPTGSAVDAVRNVLVGEVDGVCDRDSDCWRKSPSTAI